MASTTLAKQKISKLESVGTSADKSLHQILRASSQPFFDVDPFQVWKTRLGVTLHRLQDQGVIKIERNAHGGSATFAVRRGRKRCAACASRMRDASRSCLHRPGCPVFTFWAANPSLSDHGCVRPHFGQIFASGSMGSSQPPQRGPSYLSWGNSDGARTNEPLASRSSATSCSSW